MFRELGADGIVIGALCPDGSLDLEFVEQCVMTAGGIGVTCHRAFDMCRDPQTALEQLIAAHVDTVLTSGQAADAMNGRDCIRRLKQLADGRIHILAGGGVDTMTVQKLYAGAGIRQFHLSAKTEQESSMVYRNNAVNMGLAGLSEYTVWRTAASKVRAVRDMLDFMEREKERGR